MKITQEPTASLLTPTGVLIIDDESIHCEWIAHLLDGAGETPLFKAASGEEALECLRIYEAQIGLVVCDLKMPGMDGLELLRRIGLGLGQGQADHKPAVIISSALDASVTRSVEVMVKAVGLNVLGSLQKPAKATELQKLLQQRGSAPSSALPARAVELQSFDVDRALANGEFEPIFQPKVDLETGTITGVEALARWNHPIRGQLLPAEFLPLIESLGRMPALTQAIVSAALQQVVIWREQGCNLNLSLNLSISALDKLSFCEDIQSLLATVQLTPRDITFEVIENAGLGDVGRTLETMTRLRLNGFGLALDDFGKGFSGFEQLSIMPFTELKIDRTFVTGASHVPRIGVMVRSCIELANRLNLNVVAQGVETQEDWDFLIDNGAHEAQGYFIARPMQGAKVPAWVQQWSKRSVRDD